MSHFEQRMEADLVAIRDWIWQLGGDVEHALRQAKQALLMRDEDLAYATVLNDNPINRNSRTCDRMCHAFIARHLPGAGHLREIAASIRVNVALERMGDYAVTISRESLQLEQILPPRFIAEIDALSDDSFQILHESRLAFRHDNSEQAKALMVMAKRVERRMDTIYDDLFRAAPEISTRTAMTLFIVFNMLKRVADQSKNICDQTVYAVRGVVKIPKVYKILFLDRPGSHTGILALALARKIYPTAARFRLAVAGGNPQIPTELQSFLTEKGLDSHVQVSAGERLNSVQHDLDEFDVVVALQGKVSDFIGRPPFHTSALNWNIQPAEGEDQVTEQYRDLHARITGLIDLLAGDEAA